MWKRTTALILLLAFAASTFSKAMIVFGFYLNQPTIAATLCENRDRPVMKCGGKCQLAKQLEKEEKKDAQNPDRKAENKSEEISSRSFYGGLTAYNTSSPVHYFIIHADGKPVGRSFSVFHPPITVIHTA